MEFHAKRGNSENFIREEKYGRDLKHFPCQKLKANHAYGLLAMVAHNFLRMVSLIDNPQVAVDYASKNLILTEFNRQGQRIAVNRGVLVFKPLAARSLP